MDVEKECSRPVITRQRRRESMYPGEHRMGRLFPRSNVAALRLDVGLKALPPNANIVYNELAISNVDNVYRKILLAFSSSFRLRAKEVEKIGRSYR